MAARTGLGAAGIERGLLVRARPATGGDPVGGPRLLASQVRALADWAASSGLRRTWPSMPMGNASGLGVAADHLPERPDLRFGIVHWWQASAEVAAEAAIDGDDVHANRAETALMLALALRDLIGAADDEDRTRGWRSATPPRVVTNGVTGREATAELGDRLAAGIVSALVGIVERARVEQPPLVAHAPQLPPPPGPLAGTRSGGPPC